MDVQAVDPPPPPSAQVVANAFVEQYYHILHQSPELVFRFYQDSSSLSRQEENGDMTFVKTMHDINEKILSLDYTNYKAEIKTADAQESHNDGVIVLVTGCLTRKDNLKRNFAQTFFLAPQAKGYFVLNDVFRYVGECGSFETNNIPIEEVDDSRSAQPAIDTDVVTANESSDIQSDQKNQASESEGKRDTKEEEVQSVPQLTENQVSAMAESSQTSAKDDGTKNSYASIVKKAKGSPGPTKVYVPTNTVKSSPSNARKQISGPMNPASSAEPSVQINVESPGKLNAQEEVEGYSIYVRNLPIDVMVDNLEQEFKKFGPIKEEGVQVRSNRQQGACYGFVEFLSAESMERAIEASPINVGGRKAFVEMKRTGGRVDNGRGRFSSGRGGFRSDSFKGRGGYGSGRGFGRNDYGGRGEHSGRGRGSGGRGGEGYQRGRARGSRGGSRNSSASAT